MVGYGSVVSERGKVFGYCCFEGFDAFGLDAAEEVDVWEFDWR